MTLKVSGMTCDGCTRAVERVVKRVDGVEAVAVDLASGRVDVTGDPARDAVVKAIEKAGYSVAAEA